MNFALNPNDQAFRDEVREFVAEHWTSRNVRSLAPADAAEAGEEFERQVATRGWLTMAWPIEYGGQNASHIRQAILREELALAGAPGAFGQEYSMVGPMLMLHGTEEQKQEFLPKIASGELRFCQGFSEPGAGSDLASLQTRAVRDGDDFVINGQKIWTSDAVNADWIHVLTRTNPDAPKHRGVSYFLVPMDSPGLTVRPIQQMTGRSNFNETFFEDVRVPRHRILGEEDRGWYVATTTLDLERSDVQRAAGVIRDFGRLEEAIEETPLATDPGPDMEGKRARLTKIRIDAEVGRWLSLRVASLQEQGKVPNHEASMAKAYNGELQQSFHNAAVNTLGMYGQLMPDSAEAPSNGYFPMEFMQSVAKTIAGGTSEVNRNVIATRGLGMPRG